VISALLGPLYLLAILGYASTTGLSVAGLARQEPRYMRAAFLAIGLAAAAHSVVVVLHTTAAHRLPLGPAADELPFGGWDHGYASLAWLLATTSVIAGTRWPRARLVSAVLGGVALALCLAGLLVGHREMAAFLPDVLSSAWFPIHALSSYASFATFALSAAAAILYLVQDRRLKQKRLGHPGAVALPSIDVLDSIGRRSFLAGLVLLGLGITTGTFWAAQVSRDAGSGGDIRPKVVITLVLWIVYLVAWQARSWLGFAGRRAAWATILAFVLLLGSFVGVAHA
jgi:ABC-type uncharacterized transport system permease subunit